MKAAGGLAPSFSPPLLARVEDAGLNASAPPQQRWLDGWLVRFSPGKAKRARCINAVAAGRLPLPDKLALAAPVFAEAELPMLVRITLQQQVSAQLEAHFGDKVFKALIPRNVRLAEAPSYGQAGVVFDPTSKGALAYIEFAREMVERIKTLG